MVYGHISLKFIVMLLKIPEVISKHSFTRHFPVTATCRRCFSELTSSSEHNALRATIRKIIDEEVNPHVDKWEREKMFPAHEIFPKFGKAGLLGITKPTVYGGSGLDLSFGFVFGEELANLNAQGVGLGIAAHTDVATATLARFGSVELCEEFLVPAITGDAVGCIGVSEPSAASDVAGIRTTAKKSQNSDYVINGSKMWITNGFQADWMCMLANTDPSGRISHRNKSLIVVPLKSPGVHVSRKIDKIGNCCSDTAEIYFEDVRVPGSHLIGEEGMGFMYQMMMFEHERLAFAASVPAVLDRVIKMTIEYCRNRNTFGKPLIDNQYIHFRLAELQTEVECLRSLSYRCLQTMMAGESAIKLLSMAKIKAGRLTREVTDSCLQFWGGMGYASDSLISRFHLDGRLASIGGGADEIMLGLVCKFMGTLPNAKNRTN